MAFDRQSVVGDHWRTVESHLPDGRIDVLPGAGGADVIPVRSRGDGVGFRCLLADAEAGCGEGNTGEGFGEGIHG